MPISPSASLNLLGGMAIAFAIGLLFMLAIGFTSWARDPRDRHAMRAMVDGPNLAHWTCSVEERQRFLRQELGRLVQMVARRLLYALAVGVGLPILVILLAPLRHLPVNDSTRVYSGV